VTKATQHLFHRTSAIAGFFTGFTPCPPACVTTCFELGRRIARSMFKVAWWTSAKDGRSLSVSL